jgi:hypothetical protein
MSNNPTLSVTTRRNWWIDAGLALGALLAALSGIYFLFFPVGGYQGGRNPMYGVTVLFERAAWDDLHTWSGVLMIAIVLVHLTLHWSWVTSMFNRTLKQMRGRVGPMNARGRFNLGLNLVVGLSFLLTAISGVYFMFFPAGRGSVDPLLLFSRLTWDLIHTWSGSTLIVAAILHFAIHWKWIIKVTRNLATGGSARRPETQAPSVGSLSQ